jgi:hypothetical protein
MTTRPDHPPCPHDALLRLVRVVGALLYGDRWQAPLSRDLQVSDRQVRRWDAEERQIPDDIADDLLRALEGRIVELKAARKRLRKYGARL